MSTRVSPRDIGHWTLAHGLAKGEEYFFDYILYPYMLFAGGKQVAERIMPRPVDDGTGYWVGFALMFGCSIVFNIGYVLLYDRTRRDWFGFERLRSVGGSPAARWPVAAAGLRVGFFAYLALWHSPLFATLWARSRHDAYRMAKSDWAVFALAIVVANLGWAGCLTVAAGIATALQLL